MNILGITMYRRQIENINKIIDKTGKAIIGLGCSFVQGQGAFDEEIVNRYGTIFTELGNPLEIGNMTDNEKNKLLKEFPTLELGHDKKILPTFMEYKNAFTNVLAEKYFEGEYAPINLGIRGCGNRATIKELYFYPEINWHKLKEIIVIYCPSGPERFDFANDQYHDHGHWICMWPNDDGKTGPRQQLWLGYKNGLYSEKFEVLEQIAHVQELLLWCKHHNAKLIITPGFDGRYTREYFKNSIGMSISREMDGTRIKKSFFNSLHNKFDNSNDKEVEKLVNLFPWDNIFEPDGMSTFADMAIKQEYPDHLKSSNYHFWSFLGKGSPNNWITPCAHPSAKAHDYFAKLLHQHILTQLK